MACSSFFLPYANCIIPHSSHEIIVPYPYIPALYITNVVLTLLTCRSHAAENWEPWGTSRLFGWRPAFSCQHLHSLASEPHLSTGICSLHLRSDNFDWSGCVELPAYRIRMHCIPITGCCSHDCCQGSWTCFRRGRHCIVPDGRCENCTRW